MSEQIDNVDLFILNTALNHAVADGVITDSEADHLENIFKRGQDALG